MVTPGFPRMLEAGPRTDLHWTTSMLAEFGIVSVDTNSETPEPVPVYLAKPVPDCPNRFVAYQLMCSDDEKADECGITQDGKWAYLLEGDLAFLYDLLTEEGTPWLVDAAQFRDTMTVVGVDEESREPILGVSSLNSQWLKTRRLPSCF